MDVDDDDDFYAPAEDESPAKENEAEVQPKVEETVAADELEEGEEEDDDEEDSDSDIDIITERKDGTKAAPPSNARYNEIRNIPQRTGTGETGVKVAPVKKESSGKGVAVSGSELPAVATSKIDVNAKPMYEPAGKPITQVNIDEDLPENDKPWRRPGTDISDYFNYGFDEFTWALYASKQDNLRSEFDQDKIAQNQKKMFEEMNMMMAMGGMPGMPGMPTGAAGAGGGMSIPGMEGVPPEMQAMMQQMMAQGIDPSQVDPAAMFATMSGGQAASGTGVGQAGNQNQAFGQQGFGQGQQQMGFGYDQGMANTGNRGNFRGRGRGGNRW